MARAFRPLHPKENQCRKRHDRVSVDKGRSARLSKTRNTAAGRGQVLPRASWQGLPPASYLVSVLTQPFNSAGSFTPTPSLEYNAVHLHPQVFDTVAFTGYKNGGEGIVFATTYIIRLQGKVCVRQVYRASEQNVCVTERALQPDADKIDRVAVSTGVAPFEPGRGLASAYHNTTAPSHWLASPALFHLAAEPPRATFQCVGVVRPGWVRSVGPVGGPQLRQLTIRPFSVDTWLKHMECTCISTSQQPAIGDGLRLPRDTDKRRLHTSVVSILYT